MFNIGMTGYYLLYTQTEPFSTSTNISLRSNIQESFVRIMDKDNGLSILTSGKINQITRRLHFNFCSVFSVFCKRFCNIKHIYWRLFILKTALMVMLDDYAKWQTNLDDRNTYKSTNTNRCGVSFVAFPRQAFHAFALAHPMLAKKLSVAELKNCVWLWIYFYVIPSFAFYLSQGAEVLLLPYNRPFKVPLYLCHFV